MGPAERIETQSTEDGTDHVVKTHKSVKGNASGVYQLILNAVDVSSPPRRHPALEKLRPVLVPAERLRHVGLPWTRIEIAPARPGSS